MVLVWILLFRSQVNTSATHPNTNSFHYDCIVEWSKRQTWCPFCRRTFTTITHKALDLQHLPIDSAPDVGLIDLDALPGTLVEEPLVVEPKTQVCCVPHGVHGVVYMQRDY